MSPRLSVNRPLALGGIVVMLLLGGLVGWGGFTKLAGAVVASGTIVVDRNRQVVQHPDGGVVLEILVEEGDIVAAEAPLIRLDPEGLANEMAIVENELFELVARRARLEAERDGAATVSFAGELQEAAGTRPDVARLMAGQAQLFEARLDSTRREIEELDQRVLQISRRIEGIEAQQAAIADQLDLIEQDVEAQRGLLESGLTQASRVRALEREYSQLLGMQGELTASQSEAAERLAESRITIIRLEAERREEAIAEIRDLQLREFELREQRLALSQRLDRLEIRAPVAGVVHELAVFNERAVITPAEPVLYLVPQDQPLVATVQIDPIHIEQVFPSQRTVLQLPAFDSKRMPELDGEVVRVSPDTYTDERSGLTYYRAEIRMSEDELAKLPEDLHLIPGMPVTAFIRTTDRTPLNYLVGPITRYFSRALREG